MKSYIDVLREVEYTPLSTVRVTIKKLLWNRQPPEKKKALKEKALTWPVRAR